MLISVCRIVAYRRGRLYASNSLCVGYAYYNIQGGPQN